MERDCNRCSQLPDCLFSPLGSAELHQLACHERKVQFTKGTTIYTQGTTADSIYVLCKGTVSLMSLDINGRKRIACFARSGEPFGLDSLLPQNGRLYTAVARELCEAVCLSRDTFARLLRSRPGLMWRFVAALNVSIHQSQQWRLLFTGDRIRKRLANALVECQSYVGNVSQVELSELLGIPTETVNRQIHGLQQERSTKLRRKL
jgi:CRP-like cAMP-binding protein